MTAAPKVLMLWAGRPGYIPPPTLSANQVTIYSHHDRQHPGTINPQRQLATRQDYDVEQVVRQLDDPASFDLVCVSGGANENNKPRNLGIFRCPTVHLVGDTHHIRADPIRYVRRYLEEEPYDCVLSMHNRDHMKWWRDLPGCRLGWIPGLTAENVPATFTASRDPVLAFVGSWRRSHPRRKKFLERFNADDIPVDHRKLGREASARLYADALLAFNCSLNGDLNMRVHEILSAGGCLLTDRLATASGLDDMLKEDHDYIGYGSYAELRDKIAYYLAHPDKAVAIARQGLQTYQSRLRPDHLAQRFLEWVLDGQYREYDYTDGIEPIQGLPLESRCELYEIAMRRQLWQEKVPVLAIGPRARQISRDLDGLIRVYPAALVATDAAIPRDVEAISIQEARFRSWSLVIVDREQESELVNLGIRAETTFTV